MSAFIYQNFIVCALQINKEIDKAYLKNVPDIFVNDIKDIQRY